MYASSDGKHTLFILNDDDPINPREDCDPFGRMICWHRRYRLGDKHSYSEPIDFLHDLYQNSIRDNGERLVSFLKEGSARGARLEYNPCTHEWDLLTPNYWRSTGSGIPTQWEVTQSAIDSELNAGGWFLDEMLDALTIDDLKELLVERDDLVILPLYFYDHSIQSISTGSFVGRAQHAEWDSGQVGYVYADRGMIEKDFGAVTPDTVEKARKLLDAETECYDKYIRGESYGFRLYEDGEEIDSCWGFLGDLGDLKLELRTYLPADCMALLDQLEPIWETESEYMRKHEVA